MRKFIGVAILGQKDFLYLRIVTIILFKNEGLSVMAGILPALQLFFNRSKNLENSRIFKQI
jgi:hypothetical protein